MPVSISGTNGVTFPDNSLQAAAASPYVLKNRIINGDMVISQRNGTSSVTPTVDNTYTLDRWTLRITQASKLSVQQNAASVTPPVGFTNYLGATSLSSYSIVSSDYFNIRQLIEGFNVADLGWGTANAKTITLSFWVRSSLTGTFGGALNNSAFDRSYPFTYTISVANTWEQKTITIAGDTSGTWLSTNGIGLSISFGLGIGSTYTGAAGAWAGATYLGATGATSVVGTNGATFYITGVQLEQNTSATPFERRLYNQELANCQRYCQQWTGNGVSTQVAIAMGFQISSTASIFNVQTAVPMRTVPTITFSSIIISDSVSYDAAVSALAITNWSSTSTYTQATHSAAGTAGNPVRLSPTASTSGYLNFSAEL
jgi:hypothetical protein